MPLGDGDEKRKKRKDEKKMKIKRVNYMQDGGKSTQKVVRLKYSGWESKGIYKKFGGGGSWMWTTGTVRN